MEAIKTSYRISMARAVGMIYPAEYRSYNDPISLKLLSKNNQLRIKVFRLPLIRKVFTWNQEKKFPGTLAYYLARFSYFESTLKDELRVSDISSVVNLGAGMDTMAYCVEGADKIHFFEVDHPNVIKDKKERIKQLFGALPAHVTYVPIDFNSQDVYEELKKAGFDFSSKALFIYQGVSGYLSQESNNRIFEMISKAASGTKLVFSYVPMNFISGKDLQQKSLRILHDQFVKNNVLIHGYNPSEIGSIMSNYGFSTIEHKGIKEVCSKRAKTKFPEVAELERLVLAQLN